MASDDVSKTIETSVRPARVALLLNAKDSDWMQTCLRVIEWSTSVWGGWYSCLIPTDGDIIDERFWQLLERFNPDYIYAYQKTGKDIKIAEPERFQAIVKLKAKQFIEQYPDAGGQIQRSTEETLEGSATEAFVISDKLYAQLMQRLNPFRYRGETTLQHIEARPEQMSYPLTDLTHLTQYLAGPLHVATIELEASTPLQLLVYTVAGKIWPELADKLQGANVQFHVEEHSSDTLQNLLCPLWKDAQYTSALPLVNCAIYYPVGYISERTPALVVVGDCLEDFCLYYTLSRMRGHAVWLPKSLMDFFIARHNGRELAESVYRPGEEVVYAQLLRFLAENTKRNNLLFASCSLGTDDLNTVAQAIARQAGQAAGKEHGFSFEINPPLEAPLPYVRRLYERNNLGKRYRDQFHNGLSVNFVDTPKPKHLKQVPPYELFWITEVKIENYQLPLRPEFGPATIVHPNYDTDEVRVTRDGYAYFCPYIAYFGGDIDTNLVKPRIQVLEPLDVFERLFSAAGHHIQYSDKGNYHLECRRKFSSLADFATFWREDTHRRLLDLYFDRGNSEQGKGDKIGDRRYLDFLAFERIAEQDTRAQQDIAKAVAKLESHMKEQDNRAQSFFYLIGADVHICDEMDLRLPYLKESEKAKRQEEIRRGCIGKAAAELIEDLLLKGVLHRGFVFKCEACRQLGWYAVEDVTEQFRCLRCRKTQVYTQKHWNMPHEPSWFYQLDEIVYEAYRNNGHVPTLTLDLLRRSAKNSFFYLPECELLKHRGDKKQNMELDFCCCVDGNIYIGEAKKADRLETKDEDERKTLGKYRDLANDIGAKVVILSTFSKAWNERTVTNARAIIGEERLRLFANSELLNLNRSNAISE